MSRLTDYLYVLTITLWVGTLWAIGSIVAPVLFHQLSNRTLAGMLAGRLFWVEGLFGMACAGYILAYLLWRESLGAFKTLVFWLVVTMLLLTLAGHFGVAPLLGKLRAQALPHEVMQSIFRNRFATWHGVSSVMYVIQSVLGLILVTRVLSAR